MSVPCRLAATLLGVAALCLAPGGAGAQPGAQPGAQQDDEPPYLRPSRPVIANDADVQRPGVLQVEVGYSGYRHADEFREQQAAEFLLRYAFTRRFLAHAAVDPVESQVDPSGRRATGVGDVQLLGQGVLVPGAERHPAVALAYGVKLPTASASAGLGTGKVDHEVVLLVSREFSGTTVDFNAAYLNNGRAEGAGRTAGGQWALAVGREPERRGWGVQAELATENLDAAEPRGTFALGAATYRAGERVRLDVGLRAGLTHDSPRANVFAGVTTGATLARRGR